MDATSFFNIILRLTIWFLLTADLSPANVIIGVSIALLLPRSKTSLGALKDWLRVLWKILVAIPQAYIEAIQIMLRPHNEEVLVCPSVKPQRTPGLIFLDIFLITFTPKTIVLRYHEGGWYEVHEVRRSRKRSRKR
ncbi:MAG: cation:proton antiporter [Okeania sp. SIO3I5]|uniref:Na+/H+ antiporter subunit E n=1 Tax=Okeania sp. SIO3I5 TaxID=2607805 RepID=UPI0013B9F926|nr:Na+/H+ antiporter subunit E [Okeania sp. SIO3I5]NEQ38556.1 cation:proton antiporter [Okeania sp. SIO3I5]